jgi:hypothetical protein
MEYGKIMQIKYLPMRQEVGTNRIADDAGNAYTLELSATFGAMSPIVHCKETGKIYMLDWENISSMAIEAGILKP